MIYWGIGGIEGGRRKGSKDEREGNPAILYAGTGVSEGVKARKPLEGMEGLEGSEIRKSRVGTALTRSFEEGKRNILGDREGKMMCVADP